MMLNTDMCLVWSNDADGKVDMKRGCIFDFEATHWEHLRAFEQLCNISL